MFNSRRGNLSDKEIQRRAKLVAHNLKARYRSHALKRFVEMRAIARDRLAILNAALPKIKL